MHGKEMPLKFIHLVYPKHFLKNIYRTPEVYGSVVPDVCQNLCLHQQVHWTRHNTKH